MELYRIVFEKWADRLYAPGISGRWNLEGEFVVYSSSSRSLCMAESMVHKLGQGLLGARFCMMVLEVPDELLHEEIGLDQLPSDWRLESSYKLSQPLGSRWYQAMASPLLKVPSALVPKDHNWVINARHPDFGSIRLKDREPFLYDGRFIEVDKLVSKRKREEGA